MTLKLLTFNIQHCNNFRTNEIDYDIIADAIKSTDADIIGLNEVRDKGVADDFLAQAQILAQKLNMSYYYFAKAIDEGENNPYGNAILSRFPILCAETVMIPDPAIKKYSGYYETRCIAKIKVGSPTPLTVLVTHFGLNLDEQENAVSTVISAAENEKCVIMGDFNITPDESVLTCISDKYFDASKVNKNTLLSFPSDKPQIKIDYIFVSRDIKVLSSDIPAIVASDHRPHSALIQI